MNIDFSQNSKFAKILLSDIRIFQQNLPVRLSLNSPKNIYWCINYIVFHTSFLVSGAFLLEDFRQREAETLESLNSFG